MAAGCGATVRSAGVGEGERSLGQLAIRASTRNLILAIEAQADGYWRIFPAVTIVISTNLEPDLMTDQGCMMRAYSRRVVQLVNQCKEMNTFIPALAYQFSKNPTEVTVGHERRHAGKSKYSLYRTRPGRAHRDRRVVPAAVRAPAHVSARESYLGLFHRPPRRAACDELPRVSDVVPAVKLTAEVDCFYRCC